MEIFTIFGEYYSKEYLKKELAPYIKIGDILLMSIHLTSKTEEKV